MWFLLNVWYFELKSVLINFLFLEAKDCKVSSWLQWGDCSAKCGIGFMKRTRRIIQYPENGGESCPVLRQTRGCNVNACRNTKNKCKFLQDLVYDIDGVINAKGSKDSKRFKLCFVNLAPKPLYYQKKVMRLRGSWIIPKLSSAQINIQL